MANVRPITGELVAAVGCGMGLPEPLGLRIEPLCLGAVLRSRDGGKTRRWVVECEDNDIEGCHYRMKTIVADPRETGEAMAVVVVNRVLKGPDGRWYVYGHVDDVALRGGLVADAPRVCGKLAAPQMGSLRDACEEWVTGWHGKKLAALFPDTDARPARQDDEIPRAGPCDSDGLPL